MRLTFLGTRGEVDVFSRRHKMHSSLLVEAENFKLLVDAGETWKGKVPEVNAILLTHLHKDHAAAVLENYEPYIHKSSLDTTYKKPSKYKEIGDEPFKLGPFRVQAVPVYHSIKAPAVGFLIEHNRTKIAYFPDVIHIPNRDELFQDVDLYIGDGSSLERNLIRRKNDEIYGHSSIKTQSKWHSNLVFTHFGEEAIENPDKLSKLADELNFVFAEDGFSFEVERQTHAAKGQTAEKMNVRPAIYLVEPHARLIWEKKKTLIVKKRKFEKYINQPIYWVSQRTVYGILVLKPAKELDAEYVRTKLRERHQITDEEWTDWQFPQKGKVYVYDFVVQKYFAEPYTDFEAPPGVQTFIRSVAVPERFELRPKLETTLELAHLVEMIERVEEYDPTGARDDQLRDDWRIVCGWYATALDPKKKIKFTKRQIVDIAKKIVKELTSRNIKALRANKPPVITFRPKEMKPAARELFERVRKELKQENFIVFPVALTVPIYPSGQTLGKELSLQEILDKYNDIIYLRRPYVTITGGLANVGKTVGDIEVVIHERERIPSRDIPVEFRLVRAWEDVDMRNRFHFHYLDEYGGEFTNYVPLYDLALVPSERKVVELEEQMQEAQLQLKVPERIKDATESLKEDRVELGRFFFMMKPTKGFVKGEVYKPENLVKLLKEYPVAIEKKYDGVTAQVHKRGKQITIWSESGYDITDRLPSIVKEMQAWDVPDDAVLLVELELWEEGKYLGRERTSGYLAAKTPPDDAGMVVNIFDVVYFFDREARKHDLNLQAGDIHNEPYEVRRRYLELLPVEQSSFEKLEPHFNIVPYKLATTPQQALKFIKQISGTIYAEGVVSKELDSPYNLKGATREWLKYKKTAELHGIVVKRTETKTKGVYTYDFAVVIPKGWKIPDKRRVVVKDKEYLLVGTSGTTTTKVPVGGIISINFEEVFHHKEDDLQWIGVYVPKFLGWRREQTVPDDALEVISRAKDEEVLKVVKHAREMARDFVIQHHYRGKSAHIDFRYRANDYLLGFTVADLVKGAIKEPVTTLEQAKRLDKMPQNWKISNEPGMKGIILYAEPKKPAPLEWLRVEGVVKPGEVGATRYEYGVFSILQRGKLHLGAQKTYFKEYFLTGKPFDGRWVARKLPNIWKDPRRRRPKGVELPPLAIKKEFIWFFWKPKDQTPYVLSKRAVEDAWIPEYNVTALPPEIADKIPEEYKYWKNPDKRKRLEIRDALVAKKELLRKVIKLEDYVFLEAEEPSPPDIPKPVKAKFVLQHHWWKKREIIRVGPSAEHWDLRLDVGKPFLVHFVLDDNILEVEETSAIYKEDPDKAWMKKEGYLEPSSPGNPTKDTPAWIRILDSGSALIFEMSDMFAKIEFRGEHLKGLYTFEREDPTINMWVVKKSELPEPE